MARLTGGDYENGCFRISHIVNTAISRPVNVKKWLVSIALGFTAQKRVVPTRRVLNNIHNAGQEWDRRKHFMRVNGLMNAAPAPVLDAVPVSLTQF